MTRKKTVVAMAVAGASDALATVSPQQMDELKVRASAIQELALFTDLLIPATWDLRIYLGGARILHIDARKTRKDVVDGILGAEEPEKVWQAQLTHKVFTPHLVEAIEEYKRALVEIISGAAAVPDE